MAGLESYYGIIMMVAMIAIMYFIIIRPQKKQEKALRAMIAALKVGDKIVTIGGIHGKILVIKDDTLLIETGSGTQKAPVKIARWAIKECLTIKE